MCSACAGDYQNPDRTASEAKPGTCPDKVARTPRRTRGRAAMDDSEAIEILVGPRTITEVYAAPSGDASLCAAEGARAWEENQRFLRAARRRRWLAAALPWMLCAVLAAAGVWLLLR